MRLTGFIDVATGIVVVPLIALGMCFLITIAHNAIAELGTLALVLQGV